MPIFLVNSLLKRLPLNRIFSFEEIVSTSVKPIFSAEKILFTKLDETDVYGSILSTKLYAGTDLSYVCDGQGVPDDLNVINIQHIVKQLLGGK